MKNTDKITLTFGQLKRLIKEERDNYNDIDEELWEHHWDGWYISDITKQDDTVTLTIEWPKINDTVHTRFNYLYEGPYELAPRLDYDDGIEDEIYNIVDYVFDRFKEEDKMIFKNANDFNKWKNRILKRYK